MSRTDELIRLAEAATDWDCNTIRAFQENANPQTVKQMALLMKRMAEALKQISEMQIVEQMEIYEPTLAAYERFEKGE